MPVRLLVAAALIVLCTSGIGYFLYAENDTSFHWKTASGSSKVAPDTTGSPEKASAKVQEHSTTPPKEPSDDALGFMLTNVAQQYAQTIRYPEYSVPLSKEQAEAYAGNRFEPIALPLPGEGKFTVTLEKYRFVAEESILIAATVSGPQVVSDTMKATLERSETRDTTASTSLSSTDNMYQGVLEADGEPGDYRLIVEARIDGKTVRHVSSLTIEPDLGEFDGIGSTRISNNDLVIPVLFDANEPGYYSLSAQLVDNGNPIAQLQAEQRLDGTQDTIELKAHGSVIASRNISGNLQLQNLQVRRMPAMPGDRTDYGYGPDEGYTFSPPDLTSLRDEPARDPESEQRAALLQKLADKF